jgi:hypothetical protein
MRYETVQKLMDEDFKRSTGVQRSTFEKMPEVVEAGLCDFVTFVLKMPSFLFCPSSPLPPVSFWYLWPF